MNVLQTTLAMWIRVGTVLMCLAIGGKLAPAFAQEYNLRIGPPSSEERAKATKEMLDKLPAEQAAAYLRSQQAWEAVANTAQWGITLALPIAIVALVLRFRRRRQELAHEVMRMMVEKGLPVPAELINPAPPPKPALNDLRRGLIWFMLGVGLAFALHRLFAEMAGSLWTLGLIPAFIGAAYLICWTVGLIQQRPFNAVGAGVILATLGIGAALGFSTSANVYLGDRTLDDFANLGLVPAALGGALLLGPLVRDLLSRERTSPWPGVLWITVSAATLAVFRLCHLETWKFWLIPIAIGAVYLSGCLVIRKAEHGNPSPR